MPSPDPYTAPTPHPSVRPEWLALCHEEILDPGLPIVDPHHHLVDRANTGRYLLPELLADTEPELPRLTPGGGPPAASIP